MTALHPFQEKVIADVDAAIAAGQRRIVIVVPTGGGKTVIASAMIKRVAQGRGVHWCWRIGAKSSSRPAASCATKVLRTASSKRA